MQHAPGFLALVNEAMSHIREISVDEVMAHLQRKDAVTVIDVREESEWNAGRISGAIHLSKGIIERDVETMIPDKITPLILYCGGGFRSALSADNLQKMGYTNVTSMAGGWRAWKERGFPIK